jgi:hypothetical protein
MGNNTQNSILAPLAVPLVLLARVAVKGVRSLSSRMRTVDHYASYKEGKIGLAELVRHRGSMMETLHERRKTLPSGEVVVHARFRFVGERTFFGGNRKYIRPGDIIFAEFILGRNKGEFILSGGAEETLPSRALFYWGNPKKGPGNITLGSS